MHLQPCFKGNTKSCRIYCIKKKTHRYINQNRTNYKPFSALLFSAIQDQINRKGVHLLGCSILTISKGLKDEYLPQYHLFTFFFFYRLAVYSEKILTLGHFNLVTKWAHSCTLSPLVIVLCSWSQISISCLCVEHNMLPSEQRKTFFEWPAREPGQRWDWASGQAAKTEPLLPFSFPSVFRKGCVIKA